MQHMGILMRTSNWLCVRAGVKRRPSPSSASYLPGHSSQNDRRQHAEEHQAFRDEAEVPGAPGGHDLVEAAADGSLGPPRILALAQLGVEAPHGDEQNYVADGPEKAKQAKTRNHQVPLLQLCELLETRERYYYIE